MPDDPAALLRGLDQQYDVAVRFELGNVPAAKGKELLAMLDEQMGPVLGSVASEQTLELLGKSLESLDQVTLGWARHASSN